MQQNSVFCNRKLLTVSVYSKFCVPKIWWDLIFIASNIRKNFYFCFQQEANEKKLKLERWYSLQISDCSIFNKVWRQTDKNHWDQVMFNRMISWSRQWETQQLNWPKSISKIVGGCTVSVISQSELLYYLNALKCNFICIQEHITQHSLFFAPLLHSCSTSWKVICVWRWLKTASTRTSTSRKERSALPFLFIY